MNQLFGVASVLLLLLASACDTRQRTDNQSALSTQTTAAIGAEQTSGRITARLAGLGLTADSHWRGINLGDDFQKLQSIETAEPFERDDRHAGYTVEFPNLESMDVLYYQHNGKVSAIDVDLYLNNRTSVNDYTKELNAYFSARYGAPKPSNGGTVWNGPADEQVSLKDVSKGKDFGLKIKIAPTSGATSASAK